MKLETSHLALTFRIGNVDSNKYFSFRESEAQKYAELMRELEGLGGFTLYIRTTHEDVLWVNNFISGLNPLNAADLTWLEVNG